MLRRQPPVHSPVQPADLWRATSAAVARDTVEHDKLHAALRTRFNASQSLLTDSGTSALLLAMQLVGRHATIALPAYSCVDLASAAIGAGVRIRLYDLNPRTLAPDPDDLRRALDRGVDAVVIVHLFGYPVPIREVLELAGRAGVPVIEDAAQAAAGRLGERLLGSFGDFTVLSFGRGKGLSGGGGGALLGRGEWGKQLVRLERRLGPASPGWRNLAVASSQWALGRPVLYGIPSRIRWLKLGEMVYHPPGEPSPLSVASASLVQRALARADADAERRASNVSRLRILTASARRLRVVEPVAHAHPGFLRFPVIDQRGRRPAPDLGILRSYPGTLADQAVLHPLLAEGESAGPGARELGAWLFTLPTHALLQEQDFHRMLAWFDIGGGRQ